MERLVTNFKMVQLIVHPAVTPTSKARSLSGLNDLQPFAGISDDN